MLTKQYNVQVNEQESNQIMQYKKVTTSVPDIILLTNKLQLYFVLFQQFV